VATNFDIVWVLKEALLDRQILSDIIVKEKIQGWLRFFTRFYVVGGWVGGGGGEKRGRFLKKIKN